VPLTAKHCRQFADECIRIAETAHLEHVTALHNIAEAWLKLAEDLLGDEFPTSKNQSAPRSDKLQ